MRQKTGPQTPATDRVIKDIRRATRKHIRPKRKSALCWKACAVRSRLPLCAAVKALLRASITIVRLVPDGPGCI
jgi:hypothetical protein